LPPPPPGKSLRLDPYRDRRSATAAHLAHRDNTEADHCSNGQQHDRHCGDNVDLGSPASRCRTDDTTRHAQRALVGGSPSSASACGTRATSAGPRASHDRRSHRSVRSTQSTPRDRTHRTTWRERRTAVAPVAQARHARLTLRVAASTKTGNLRHRRSVRHVGNLATSGQVR
jgi:hypothetical protein